MTDTHTDKAADFRLWSEEKPENLHVDQLISWRTKHVGLGLKMTMTGHVRRMCNGITNKYHLMPPMTDWTGYKHTIPDDLEWSYEVPEYISAQTRTERNKYIFEKLLSIEGLEPTSCPFCGKAATWDSRGGFVTAMPHQESEFSLGCCVRMGYFEDPRHCLERWNTRALPVQTHDADTVERLRQALYDVTNPLDYMRRPIEAAGDKLSGQAFLMANDPEFIKDIARAALSAAPQQEVSVQEAAKVLMPEIERIIKSVEPHFVSHEDIEDTIHGMKIRTIVALRALSEGEA